MFFGGAIQAQLEEVANVITFLLSDEASYVSPYSYRVDGGLLNL